MLTHKQFMGSMQYPSHIRIATRASQLALKQAEMVKAALMEAAAKAGFALTVDIVSMMTTGDKVLEHPLSDIGGKGLFTKELEESLLGKHTDIAVHSMKDMPTELPKGLTIGCILEREDPRDALISSAYDSLEALPDNPVIGTSSLRRSTLVKLMRPDASIVAFRGNVPTRLEKVSKQLVHASLLAIAGLKRLGLESHARTVLDPSLFTPAVGQGAICVECREGDNPVLNLLALIHHIPTHQAVTAERALLATLDGSCRTPIGGYAQHTGNSLTLHAFLALPDGSKSWRTTRTGSVTDAETMGRDAGIELKHKAASR